MFSNRHIGPNKKEIKKMLNKLGVSSIKELIYETIPNDILLKKELELDDAISEIEFNNLMMAVTRRAGWLILGLKSNTVSEKSAPDRLATQTYFFSGNVKF